LFVFVLFRERERESGGRVRKGFERKERERSVFFFSRESGAREEAASFCFRRKKRER
jgi:hypothetical protein